MQIRRATLADLDPIEALWREMMDFHAAFDDHFTLSSQADANHRIHMTNLLQDESKRIFVADDGDQLSPAPKHAPDAGLGLCRSGSDLARLPGGETPGVPVLLLRRCDAAALDPI